MSATGSDTFLLDPEIAKNRVNACEMLRAELGALTVKSAELASIGGFGNLGSAQALRKKFEEKAVGGPDALVDVLASHIAVVDDMRAQFQACIDNAVDQESANVASLRAHDLPN